MRKDNAIKERRREALKELFEKYPEGFTVRQMVEEYPKLYTKVKQAADFLAFIRENEGSVKMIRDRTKCKYVHVPDTYKLLNKLWRKSA